jgi:hypothetical protein
MKNEHRSRYYKTAINIGPLNYYQNSRVFDIPDGRSTILPGLKYSLVTLILGWWSFSIRNPFGAIKNSVEALHINFSGGEDISKLISEDEYDEKTNYIWNNLLRTTIERLTKSELEMIIEIHDEYLSQGNIPYSDANMNFIAVNIDKLDIKNVSKTEIRDIFDALRMYDKILLT